MRNFWVDEFLFAFHILVGYDIYIYIYLFPGGYTVIDLKISSNNHTPPKINSSPWKTVVERRSFPLGFRPVFRGFGCQFWGGYLDFSAHLSGMWLLTPTAIITTEMHTCSMCIHKQHVFNVYTCMYCGIYIYIYMYSTKNIILWH